ncbi:MAG: DUF3244 domain-containing protein [Bacteroidaceae bacterium]|nr:DUF3244 domain-containing protein [Bacteroidaceae bacterium]
MRIKTLIKCMALASILPASTMMIANDNTPKEEKVIVLTNDNDYGVNTETLQVPVTATVNNQVLNVQFTGTVPHATVKVNNALTGGTITQQSMTALPGTICTVPVAGLDMGTYTVSVTNNASGESVSGDFQVNNSKE